MEWRARIFNDPPIVIIEDSDGNLFSIERHYPDIFTVATWIRNRRNVLTVSIPNPLTDTKQTRKYTEYRFMVFEK